MVYNKKYDINLPASMKKIRLTKITQNSRGQDDIKNCKMDIRATYFGVKFTYEKMSKQYLTRARENHRVLNDCRERNFAAV